MHQHLITPAAGKRLIARAATKHPAVQRALNSGTVVIIAGTTNSYVAEAVLKSIDQPADIDRSRFFRGIMRPPRRPGTEAGRPPEERRSPADVVIVNGAWQKGATVFDVAGALKEGDVILKGANAIDLSRQRAAILVGNPTGGTITTALQAVIGRRVRLLLPVGLEKRVTGDLDQLAAMLNAPGAHGPRLLPVPGEILTELHAISLLTGASATLVAGGGVCGAEGCVWLAVTGTPEQEESAQILLKQVAHEPLFVI